MPTPPDMSTTGRHGYAVYFGEVMASWVIDLTLAQKLILGSDDHKVVNVQNGAVLPNLSSTKYHQYPHISAT